MFQLFTTVYDFYTNKMSNQQQITLTYRFVRFPGFPGPPQGQSSEGSEKVQRRLEKEGWRMLEKVRERRLEKVGEGWRRLEKVRESQRKFEKV